MISLFGCKSVQHQRFFKHWKNRNPLIKIQIPYHMDAREPADTTSKQQILLILETYMKDHIRIEQQSPYMRQQIRQLPYFRLVHESDLCCLESTRMDRRCFTILCTLLKTAGGLVATGFVDVEEMVAMFLHILAHDDVINRVVDKQFARSGETVFRHFNSVLNAVLQLHGILLKKPEPITSTCTDDTWKWFEGCLGALDNLYIKVSVRADDRPRYRTRRGDIATNVLAACNPNGEFTFVLAGWEGSANDALILKDAISCPNGLKVPEGCYYLCDTSYPNIEGFLPPYIGIRYQLSEWRSGSIAPTNVRERFNMRHSAARNVIDVALEALKDRWTILHGKSYYPVRTKCRIITACCIIHNLICREMSDTISLDEKEVESSSTSIARDDINSIENAGE